MFLLFFQNCYSYKKDMDIIHIYTFNAFADLLTHTRNWTFLFTNSVLFQ